MIKLKGFRELVGGLIVADFFDSFSGQAYDVKVCTNVQFLRFLPSTLQCDDFTPLQASWLGARVELNILGVETLISKYILIANPKEPLSKIATLGGVIYDDDLLIKWLLQCE